MNRRLQRYEMSPIQFADVVFVKGSCGISNYCFLLDCMWTHAEEIGSSAGATCYVQCGCNLTLFDASPHQKGDTESHLAERCLAPFTGAGVHTSGTFHRSHDLMCLNKFHSISGTTRLRGLSNSCTKIARWNYRDTLSNNQIQALFFFLTIHSAATSLYSQEPMQFTSAKICKETGSLSGAQWIQAW